MSVNAVGNWLILATALPAVLSVIVYGKVPWWRSWTGRLIMIDTAAFALVLSLSAVRVVFGDSGWFQVVRLCAFLPLPVVMWWRLGMFVRALRGAASNVPSTTREESGT